MVEHPDARRVAVRRIVRPADDSEILGSVGSPRADAAVADDVLACSQQARLELLTYGPDGERRGDGMRVLAASYAPRPRMVVFGAIDFAAAVARLGNFLGYRVISATRDLCSRPGPGSRTPTKWSSTGPTATLATEVEAGRIDGRTVICVSTPRSKVRCAGVGDCAVSRRPDMSARWGRGRLEERLLRLREAGLTGGARTPIKPDRS